MPSPIAILAICGTLAALLLLGGLGHWLYERRTRMARVRAAVGPRAGRLQVAGNLRGKQSQAWQQSVLNFMKVATRRATIAKDRHSRDTRTLLMGAGFKGRDCVVVYTFFKLVSPIVFLAGAALVIYGLDPIGKGIYADVAAVMAAALVGSKLPDLIVKNMRQKRLEAIRKALPDSLDMLVICAEAGLSSDAALKRVVTEISRKASVLGEELNQTALELSFMPERRTALENLSERAPLPAVNAFVNTLIQAEKYGTPLARAFKVLSQEQRTERMLKAEEKAGRLPATMTVPMMLFILPALFIVLIGPAVLDILDNFIGM